MCYIDYLVEPIEFLLGLWPSVLPDEFRGVPVLVVAFEAFLRLEEDLALITAEKAQVVDLGTKNTYV